MQSWPGTVPESAMFRPLPGEKPHQFPLLAQSPLKSNQVIRECLHAKAKRFASSPRESVRT